MSIELLNKLKELGLFQYILEIIDSEDLEFAGNEIDIISEYKYLQISMYGLIDSFFRDKYNLLGNVYSNASGFLFEAHDSIGGTHRIDSGFIGDDEHSGTFTTYHFAKCGLYDYMIDYIGNSNKKQ